MLRYPTSDPRPKSERNTHRNFKRLSVWKSWQFGDAIQISRTNPKRGRRKYISGGQTTVAGCINLQTKQIHYRYAKVKLRSNERKGRGIFHPSWHCSVMLGANTHRHVSDMFIWTGRQIQGGIRVPRRTRERGVGESRSVAASKDPSLSGAIYQMEKKDYNIEVQIRRHGTNCSELKSAQIEVVQTNLQFEQSLCSIQIAKNLHKWWIPDIQKDHPDNASCLRWRT